MNYLVIEKLTSSNIQIKKTPITMYKVPYKTKSEIIDMFTKEQLQKWEDSKYSFILFLLRKTEDLKFIKMLNLNKKNIHQIVIEYYRKNITLLHELCIQFTETRILYLIENLGLTITDFIATKYEDIFLPICYLFRNKRWKIIIDKIGGSTLNNTVGSEFYNIIKNIYDTGIVDFVDWLKEKNIIITKSQLLEKDDLGKILFVRLIYVIRPIDLQYLLTRMNIIMTYSDIGHLRTNGRLLIRKMCLLSNGYILINKIEGLQLRHYLITDNKGQNLLHALGASKHGYKAIKNIKGLKLKHYLIPNNIGYNVLHYLYFYTTNFNLFYNIKGYDFDLLKVMDDKGNIPLHLLVNNPWGYKFINKIKIQKEYLKIQNNKNSDHKEYKVTLEDFLVKNKKGEIPLSRVLTNINVDKFLDIYDLDILDVIDDNGNTVLHRLTKNANVHILIKNFEEEQKNCDLTIKDYLVKNNNGETPLINTFGNINGSDVIINIKGIKIHHFMDVKRRNIYNLCKYTSHINIQKIIDYFQLTVEHFINTTDTLKLSYSPLGRLLKGEKLLIRERLLKQIDFSDINWIIRENNNFNGVPTETMSHGKYKEVFDYECDTDTFLRDINGNKHMTEQHRKKYGPTVYQI